MAFKTFAPGVLTSSDVNTFLMRQAVITCTSSTRPASPSEGMTIYETDTDRFASYDGSAWVAGLYPGAYRSYTPSINNGSLGNGTISAKYVRVGSLIHCYVMLVFGSTSTVSTDFSFNGPVAPETFSGTSYALAEGACRIVDVSAGRVLHGGIGHFGSQWFYPQGMNVTDGYSYLRVDQTTASVPFTWASGDLIYAQWIYEAGTP